MKPHPLAITAALSLLLSACATSYTAQPPASTAPWHGTALPPLTGPFHIVNPELATEYALFRQSHRFQENPGGIDVTLQPLLEIPGGCDSLFSPSSLTLGLLPCRRNDVAIFSFKLIRDGHVLHYAWYLNVQQRTSLWERRHGGPQIADAYASALATAPAIEPDLHPR